MRMCRGRYLRLGVLGAALAALLVVSLACAAAEDTPTPVSPAPPAPPVAPTAAPVVPAPTLAPGAPTPVPGVPTPTRILPTPTPVVTGEPVYGGVLRYPGASRSFDNMDPAFSVETGFREPMFAIFDNIVRLESDGTVKPQLAESWDVSNNGKTITFHIRKGMKFHDGTTLDAGAIKWNFDRFLDPDVGSVRKKELVPPLESVELVDDYTLRMQLETPSRGFLALLTQRHGSIASPTAVEKLDSYAEHTGDFGANPVGAGPFKFKEWLVDRRIVVERFDGYWDKGKPYLDGVDFPIVGDWAIQFAMLRTGEIDMMMEMRPGDVILAERNPSIRVIEQKGTRVRYILFQTDEEPWNNKALREAFAYAIDRETAVDVLYRGMATPAYIPIGPVYGEWFDPTIKVHEYSPEKAREKLAEAGYADGFTYKHRCKMQALESDWCEFVQSMLGDVGIKAEIVGTPSATHWGDWTADKFTTPITTGMSARSEISVDLRLRWQCGNRYAMAYCNPEVDQLLNEAAAIYDIAKANPLYSRALTIIAEDAPAAPVLYESAFYALTDRVRGFKTYLDRQVRVWHLWLSK